MIVEDDVLIGGNCGVYEGTIIRARAVLAAGVVLTGSTPVYDLVRGKSIAPDADRPLEIPEQAPWSCPARARSRPAGARTRDCRSDARSS